MDITLTGQGVEEFATERVLGTRLTDVHTDFLVDLHLDTDVMAMHSGTRSRPITEHFIRSNDAHWARFGFGLWVISLVDDPETPVGRVGLRWDVMFDETRACDTSCVLTKSSWGQGVATEAVQAVVSIGLDIGLPLVAGCEADHESARRVLEKVGLIYWSDYERHSNTWAKYQWPIELAPPLAVVRNEIELDDETSAPETVVLDEIELDTEPAASDVLEDDDTVLITDDEFGGQPTEPDSMIGTDGDQPTVE